MNNIIPTKILKDDRNIYIFRIENNNLIIQATHVLYILKDLEKQIYDLIDWNNTIWDILSKISIDYNISILEIESDIINFLENLKEKKLINF